MGIVEHQTRNSFLFLATGKHLIKDNRAEYVCPQGDGVQNFKKEHERAMNKCLAYEMLSQYFC